MAATPCQERVPLKVSSLKAIVHPSKGGSFEPEWGPLTLIKYLPPGSNQMGLGLDQSGSPGPVSIKGPRLLEELFLNPGPFYSRGPPFERGPHSVSKDPPLDGSWRHHFVQHRIPFGLKSVSRFQSKSDPLLTGTWGHHFAQGRPPFGLKVGSGSVSYTHLTLPTILRV